jgi:hypothetical protein
MVLIDQYLGSGSTLITTRLGDPYMFWTGVKRVEKTGAYIVGVYIPTSQCLCVPQTSVFANWDFGNTRKRNQGSRCVQHRNRVDAVGDVASVLFRYRTRASILRRVYSCG